MSKILPYTLLFGMLVPLVQGKPGDVLVADVARDTLDIAKQLYQQSRAKNLDAASRNNLLSRAAVLFAQITKEHAGSPVYGEALYMRAVCLSELGREREAEPLLTDLSVGNYGEYSAAAAYRLGGLRARGGLWEKAETSFSLACKKTTRTELRNDSLYRMAQAQLHQGKGKRESAQKLFQQLIATDKLNPSIYKASVLALANMKTEAGDDTQAYSYFLLLLERKDLDENMRGKATLQAARLASRLGKQAEAEQLYSKLTRLPGMERYSGEAQMESILALYKQKNYAGVIKLVSQNYTELSDKEKEARRALIVGQSYMELKQYEQAASWFSIAEESVPRTVMAADASYRRIVCAQQCRSNNFLSLVKRHISTYAQPGSPTVSMPCNDLVRLMYADRVMAASSSSVQIEESLRQANLQEAARQFDAINYENLPLSVRPDAEYKRAWCASRTDSYDPVPALDRFIANYKDNPRIPDAYALRGATLLKQGKVRLAIADFDTVINNYADSAAAPACMQKAAQAAAKDSDTNRMVKYYEDLIRCGDRKVKASALAEAHYNIARARYEKDPKAAVEHFREAKLQDSQHYGNNADMSIVQCYFKMKDAPNLLTALQEMETRNADLYAKQPPVILRWCGWTCYQAHNYALAEKYLGDSVAFEKHRETYKDVDGTTKERPATESLVWKTLARSRLEIGKYAEGLEAADHYLSMEDQPYRLAEGMRDKALLLVGLGRAEEARHLCGKAIELGIDGPIKSSLFLALGDAWYADRQYGEAAKYYGRTANIVNDKELKPIALYKVSVALRKDGKLSEASEYESSLKTEFPTWTPSESVQRQMGGKKSK